jgi:maleamate amidohydrolase
MTPDDTDRIYARAGFGERIRRGTRPAILVVDFTRGFTEAQYPTGADLTEPVLATRRLLDAARRGGLLVVFTRVEYAAQGRDGGAWLEKAPGLGVLREGTPLVELDPRLPREPDDIVLVKKGASAFFGTNLAAVLATAGVDTVIVCGATTSGCVRASAVDSVQSGFPTLVVRDCVGDRAAGPHHANLFDIDAKYGDVIDLEDALGYLDRISAAERV